MPAARRVASRVRYQGADLQSAASGLILDVARLRGDGGVIAVSSDAEIAFAWNSDGMKRAGFRPTQVGFAATL